MLTEHEDAGQKPQQGSSNTQAPGPGRPGDMFTGNALSPYFSAVVDAVRNIECRQHAKHQQPVAHKGDSVSVVKVMHHATACSLTRASVTVSCSEVPASYLDSSSSSRCMTQTLVRRTENVAHTAGQMRC